MAALSNARHPCGRGSRSVIRPVPTTFGAGETRGYADPTVHASELGYRGSNPESEGGRGTTTVPFVFPISGIGRYLFQIIDEASEFG